jgi:hypothetical protein
LKTKGGSGKKRAKRNKEAVSYSRIDSYRWSAGRGRRGFFEITRATMPQIWTFVNSKLAS